MYSYTDHDGTGNSYLYYGTSPGSTSGIEYGTYITGEDENYFSNQVGIGTTGGSTNSKLAINNGHIQTKQSSTPAIAVGGSYTGTASFTTGSTDVAGQFNVNLSSSACGGCDIVIITFDYAYAVAPTVIITPASLWAGVDWSDANYYVLSSTTNFKFRSNFSPTLNSMTYNYLIIEAN